MLTRWDMQKYARDAYDSGIRYIGGCCGFQPYHTRALAEELAAERGFLPAASEKHGSWGSGLEMHTKPWVRARYTPVCLLLDAPQTFYSLWDFLEGLLSIDLNEEMHILNGAHI